MVFRGEDEKHMKLAMCLLLIWCLFLNVGLATEEVEKISLSPTQEVQRADLYVWRGVASPKAVLVLCPGYNGNGEGLVRQLAWQDFARKHQLALMGLSFASEGNTYENRKGYYYASQGSGELLLAGIRRAFGQDLSILFYGFSGGAHFTSRFEEWKPERVIAWCAYSAAWWDDPVKAQCSPPGIIACGEEDSRYGASLIYFKQGRAAGKPWLWISVPKTGHSPQPAVEKFVRDYFHAVCEQKKVLGLWVDIDKKTEANIDDIKRVPSITAWLPDRNLFSEWKGIHEP